MSQLCCRNSAVLATSSRHVVNKHLEWLLPTTDAAASVGSAAAKQVTSAMIYKTSIRPMIFEGLVVFVNQYCLDQGKPVHQGANSLAKPSQLPVGSCTAPTCDQQGGNCQPNAQPLFERTLSTRCGSRAQPYMATTGWPADTAVIKPGRILQVTSGNLYVYRHIHVTQMGTCTAAPVCCLAIIRISRHQCMPHCLDVFHTPLGFGCRSHLWQLARQFPGCSLLPTI